MTISGTKGLMIRAVSFFSLGERHKISSNFEALGECRVDVSKKAVGKKM